MFLEREEKLATNEHVFIKNIRDESPLINTELLSEILSPKFMSPEFSGVKQIIEMLFRAHEVALKIEWPDSEDRVLKARFQVLSEVRQTSLYKQNNDITSTNPFDDNRLGDFPFAALFAQPFNTRVDENQKNVLLLLVLVFYQVLDNEDYADPFESKTLTNTSNTLRNLIKKFTYQDKSFKSPIDFEHYNYKNLENSLNALCANKNFKFPQDFASLWKTFSLSFSSIEAESDSEHDEALNNTLQLVDLDDNNENIDLTNVPERYKKDTDGNIYGSRLSLNELLHLPLRSNNLAQHEINELVKYLLVALTKSETRNSAIIAFLVTLTSKPFKDLLNIRIFSNGHSHTPTDYIDLSRSEWVRLNVKMPNSYTQKKEHKGKFNSFMPTLSLPLPIALIEAITLQFDECGEQEGIAVAELCNIDEPVGSFLSKFLKPLWKNNPEIHRQITPASLRVMMFEQLAHKYDSGYALLTLANTEYDNTTTLFYLSAVSGVLTQNYQSTLNAIGLDTNKPHSENDKMVGSELVIDTEYVKKIITEKREKLSNTLIKTSSELSYDELISQHNEFSYYITWMLITATGHRERAEYGFSPFSWDEDGGYILLSDKITYEESSVRILPLSSMVIQQITAYKNCIRDTAQRIKPFNISLSEKLSTIAGVSSCEWPLISVIYNEKLQPIIKDNIDSYFGTDFNLPLNCFRHFLSTFLRQSSSFNFAKTIMGHESHEEHMLSNYSCASLVDIKEAVPVFDNLLNTLGFKLIDYKSPKGAKALSAKSFSRKSYRAEYLYRNEKKERSTLISWANKIIKPQLIGLANVDTVEATKEALFEEAEQDNYIKFSKSTRLYWLKKVLRNTSDEGHFNLKNNMKNIDIQTDTLLRMRQSKLIKSDLNELIIKSEYYDGDFQLIKIFMSLVINSGIQLLMTPENLKVIQNSPYFENGITWFDFYEGKKNGKFKKRVVVDSLTQLLIMKNANYRSALIDISNFNGIIENKFLRLLRLRNDLESDFSQTLWSFDKLAHYTIRSRDENQCALIHAYQNNKLKSTVLSSEKLTRWLSPNHVKLFSSKKTHSSLQSILNKLSTQPTFIHENANVEKSEKLIKTLQSALSKQDKIKRKISTADLLIQTWAQFINKKGETSIEQLVDKSKNIHEVVILLILWAIDVTKNKFNEPNATMTPSRYLSDVALSLLEQVKTMHFLSLDSDELAAAYKKAINASNVKDKGGKAKRMRLFHQFLQQNFHFQPLDWSEIEPSIWDEGHVDANIISMNEYQNMLSTMKDDDSFSAADRDISRLILILCYRAGLRVGEACYLKINDLDTKNWILHVRSYYFHKLKTGPSNRRISINLLLSDNEKDLLQKQIERVKNHHLGLTDLWLFSDKTNSQCVMNITPNLTRVREIIRLISGDSSLKLHHARHSFANYLLMIMHPTYYSNNIAQELKQWSRSNDLQLCNEQFRRQFLDKVENSKSVLHAVAMAMGHVNPQTTLKHYVHCLDIILAAENEKCLFQQQKRYPNHPEFKKNSKHPILSLAALEHANCRKTLSQNKNELFGYQSIIMKTQKNWLGFIQVTICRVIEPVKLSNIKPNLQYKNLSELYDIEHIVRAAEKGLSNVEITNLLHLDFQRVSNTVDEVINLKSQIGYAGTNIEPNESHIIFETNMRQLSTYSKFIRLPSFHNLLIKVSELLKDKSQANTLVDLWKEGYRKNKGVLIPNHELETFSALINKIGYQVEVASKPEKIRLISGYKVATRVKFFPINTSSDERQYGDNKVNHAIFLMSISLASDDILSKVLSQNGVSCA